jgi:hypothetical protein
MRDTSTVTTCLIEISRTVVAPRFRARSLSIVGWGSAPNLKPAIPGIACELTPPSLSARYSNSCSTG